MNLRHINDPVDHDIRSRVSDGDAEKKCLRLYAFKNQFKIRFER